MLLYITQARGEPIPAELLPYSNSLCAMLLPLFGGNNILLDFIELAPNTVIAVPVAFGGSF